MLVQNKTDILQRTSVKGIKTDIKPGEIFEVSDIQGDYITSSYASIFGKVIKEETKETKVIKKEDVNLKKLEKKLDKIGLKKKTIKSKK